MRWPDQSKGSSVTATAQAQLKIRKQLSKLGDGVGSDDPRDEPVAKRVKRRTDRIKLEPDDDFLDPDYVLSSRPSGRGRGRPRKARFLEEEEEEEVRDTHGEVEWYKPDLRLEDGEVPTQPRPPRGRKPGSMVKRALCAASTEAENEQDLANKGLDFLQVYKIKI